MISGVLAGWPRSTVAPPGAPTNLRTGAGGSSNNIRAMWNQGSGGQPSNYEVWHSREDGQGYKLVGTVSGTTLEFTYPITFPPTYQQFYVTAVNAAGRASAQPIGVSVA